MTRKCDQFKTQKKRKSIPPTLRGKRHAKPSKVSKDMDSDCKARSKALLDLEDDSKNYSASSMESKLLVCKKDEFVLPKTPKCESSMSDKKPSISALPESEVLGKVKNFLGVISEANRRLHCDAEDHSEKYDIEVLTGNESEYIEMDLMLGVADLHTPEAVAAAESAVTGYPPVVSFAANCSNDDEDDDDGNDEAEDEEKTSRVARTNSSSEASREKPSEKRPKIVELS